MRPLFPRAYFFVTCLKILTELSNKYEHYMLNRNFGQGRCTPGDVKTATVNDTKAIKCVMSLVSVLENMFAGK